MKKNWGIGLVLAGLLGLSSHPASAVIIAIDLDPVTAGIQTTRTLTVGAIFTIDVVLDTTADVFPTAFDTTIMTVSFNDAGAVLGSGSGRAGALAGLPFTPFALDVFGGFVSTAPNAFLGVGPSLPAVGFASDTGQVGLFSGLFTVPPGLVTSVFSFDFIAVASGTSTLLASNTLGGSELALGGFAVPGGLQTATVTVPEPGALLLFGTGLLGIALTIRRRRA